MSSEDNIPLNTAGHMVGKHENGAEKSSLDKARTRLIQEGYKYNRLPDEEDGKIYLHYRSGNIRLSVFVQLL